MINTLFPIMKPVNAAAPEKNLKTYNDSISAPPIGEQKIPRMEDNTMIATHNLDSQVLR